jgi:hypothetical protein
VMKTITQTPHQDLLDMGRRSQELSLQITTLTWATSISSVLLKA